MAIPVEHLLQEALALSEADRVGLVRSLIDSVRGDDSISEDWIDEIESRLRDMENGLVESHSSDEVMKYVLENRGRGNEVSP